MKAIVDTSVWSLAFRRSKIAPSPYRDLLEERILDGKAALMGIVRQEILSGVKLQEQFERLKLELRSFPDVPLETDDYEIAGEFYNTCMTKGVKGGHADFLICACAYRKKYAVLSSDPDFGHYRKHIPLTLLQPKS